MVSVTKFWNSLNLDQRIELVEEALAERQVTREALRGVASHHWDGLPERLIIQGIYIKDALLPLLQDPQDLPKTKDS